MKMQALALGAALGFLAAITPSCGMQTCSTANCDGCCTGNVCTKRPDNSLNTTCGTSGNACVNCAASNTTCDATTFTCAGSPTGGGGAGGGMAGGDAGVGCDGCRLMNGQCQARNTNRQNNNICGSAGEMCRSCVGTATPVCENGACIAPPKRVGDQCMNDGECQATLGQAAACKRTSVAGNFTYPGGFCTVEGCGSQGTDDCPMGSACLALTGIFGEENTSCFPTGCSMANPCRSGYACFNIGSMTMPLPACLPSDLSSANPNFRLDVTSVTGNACANTAACRAPSPGAPGAGGFCITEVLQLPDGGVRPGRDGGPQPTAYVGGYCSRECRRDADCDPDGDDSDEVAICLPPGANADPICQKSCAEPNLGQSSCRTGYTCEGLTLRDGGLYDIGICSPRCDNPGAGTCPRFDGGIGGCNMTTGFCESPNRIIPVRVGDPCTGPATRCLGGTTCTGVDGGTTTCRITCMTDAQCPASDFCVDGQGGLRVCVPRPPDAGVVVDGGSADAGSVTDAGTATDAGTTADAGSTTPDAGGTCPDGGSVADGGC